MHYVTVSDGVVPAFQTHLARGLRRYLAAQCDVVLMGDDLGANKPAFKVAVDDACRLGRLGAARNGPGTRFLGADGEEGDEVEHAVAFDDQL